MATTRHRQGAQQGALIGLVVGIVLAVIGEGGSALVLNTAPYGDVAIVGFSTVYGVPASVVLGAVLGRWGRPKRTGHLALLSGAPAALVAVAQIVLQAMHV